MELSVILMRRTGAAEPEFSSFDGVCLRSRAYSVSTTTLSLPLVQRKTIENFRFWRSLDCSEEEGRQSLVIDSATVRVPSRFPVFPLFCGHFRETDFPECPSGKLRADSATSATDSTPTTQTHLSSSSRFGHQLQQLTRACYPGPGESRCVEHLQNPCQSTCYCASTVQRLSLTFACSRHGVVLLTTSIWTTVTTAIWTTSLAASSDTWQTVSSGRDEQFTKWLQRSTPSFVTLSDRSSVFCTWPADLHFGVLILESLIFFGREKEHMANIQPCAEIITRHSLSLECAVRCC